MRLLLFSSKQCIIKQLLGSVFVISGIIRVSVSVISLSLRLMTLTSTLIIPDITETSSNNCLLSTKKKNENIIIIIIIIHQTHYEKSDWSRAFYQFPIACELDMINVISAADITFIISSSMSARLLSPSECSPQINRMAERFN